MLPKSVQDQAHLALDITPHHGLFEEPLAARRSPLEVVGVTG
jgi:hypothetical protein